MCPPNLRPRERGTSGAGETRTGMVLSAALQVCCWRARSQVHYVITTALEGQEVRLALQFVHIDRCEG